MKWYRKAAEQGHAKAQFNVGVMYDDGQVVPQDSAAAAMWFRKSAEQGYVLAQYNLGSMYANGEGVPQDYVAAYVWTDHAAVQGYADATKSRDILAARMTRVQITLAQKLASLWKPSPAAPK